VVFKISPSGTMTTLYSFCSQSSCADGANPKAVLIQATNGILYGTTRNGGTKGQGAVFKITPNGTLTTLYSFCSQSGCPNGANPTGLVQASDGNFYGTTYYGGINNAGTVFKITPSGTLTTLYTFCSQSGCSDGLRPEAPLLQATDGKFYGTTGGTIFKMTPSGTLTTLYSFCSQSGCPDGEFPYTGLTQATDGNLYGTTLDGGANNVGTIFKITPYGTLTTLYSFCSQAGCPDCANPWVGLVQDTNGRLYGTTFQGSSSGDGTVFSLSVGLGPFVETEPTSGQVGTAVKILGTGLKGATSVTFNGTAATFTVVSASEITTTVPAGATTGKVQVATPKQTLTSNKQFLIP
jgi:uncharacterized repeat protein (TIGR03803 family)